MKLNWGFLGCGKISNDFANALKLLEDEACRYACAAKSAERSHKFAQDHGFEKSYGSYEELCGDANVDVVYVGTLHIDHFAHAMLALSHGKHVLVEKPCSVNSHQATKLVEFANEKGLFLMEGMWTRFFPAVRKVRELIDSGAIGDIHIVTADFGVKVGADVERVWNRKLGGGGLLDIGIYPLAFITMIFGESPTRIDACGSLTSAGVDEMASVTLQFSKNQLGIMHYNCLANSPEEVTIVGSNGRIRIHGPAHASEKISIIRDGCDEEVLKFALPTPMCQWPRFNFQNSVGFYYEAKAVSQCIKKNQQVCNEYSTSESLGIMKIMDTIRTKLCVKYEEDQ